MKIFVTGSKGFVGTNLVERLRNKYEIVEFEGDIRKMNDFRWSGLKHRHKVDVIVHLAALTKAVESIKKPHEYLETNLMGTINVLETVRQFKIPRLIYTSSCGVKGFYSKVNPYLWSKLLSEKACNMYANLYGTEIIILRPTNIYGPYNWKGVIWRFIESKKRGESLKVYGDGTQSRDFIHVYDVCDAIEKSITITNLKHNPFLFEIGTEEETSVRDLAEMISDNIVFMPQHKDKVGLMHSCANAFVARKILKWNAKIPLREGLKIV